MRCGLEGSTRVQGMFSTIVHVAGRRTRLTVSLVAYCRDRTGRTNRHDSRLRAETANERKPLCSLARRTPQVNATRYSARKSVKNSTCVVYVSFVGVDCRAVYPRTLRVVSRRAGAARSVVSCLCGRGLSCAAMFADARTLDRLTIFFCFDRIRRAPHGIRARRRPA